ncbi:MAG: helix-turn-helix transcriptional regulator [Bacteroidota bacterium]
MDIFKIHIPSGILQKSIASIVYYEGLTQAHAIERLLPDGTLNLLIELADQPQHTYDDNDLSKKRKFVKSWFSGMQTGYISISSSNRSAMMVVQFKPNGAYPILKMPVSELSNKVLDADLIFGNEIEFLRELILSETLPDPRIRLMEQWLCSKYSSVDAIPEAVIQFAVEETMLNPSNANMQAIADRTGYSQQHFITLFKKYVGISPKQYQRIVRFNQVLQEIEYNQKIEWCKLSQELGYFDQAHFIRDFKHFSGFSPKNYLVEKGEFLNYVPITIDK